MDKNYGTEEVDFKGESLRVSVNSVSDYLTQMYQTENQTSRK